MPFPPEHYALTPKQMVEMDYPTSTFAGPGPARDASDGERALNENALIVPEGFVVTQPAGGGVARSPPLSMLGWTARCYVGAGADRRPALTRACGGPDGSVVYDKRAPREPITDYNTAHPDHRRADARRDDHAGGRTAGSSGAHRAGDRVDRALAGERPAAHADHARDVRGHGGAVPAPARAAGSKQASALTEKHPARRIQEGTHDSAADARATMELALLKFTNGPGFGEPAGAGREPPRRALAAGRGSGRFRPKTRPRRASSRPEGRPGRRRFPVRRRRARRRTSLLRKSVFARTSIARRTRSGRAPGAEEAVAPRGGRARGAVFRRSRTFAGTTSTWTAPPSGGRRPRARAWGRRRRRRRRRSTGL